MGSDNYCAPNVNIGEHYTCFELQELKSIANAFNEYIKKNKSCPKKRGAKNVSNYCNIDKEINLDINDKRELWYSIYDRLKGVCPYEYCWIDLDFLDKITDKQLLEKIRWFTFKPKMTLTMKSWLSTQDINNVLQQYSDFDSSFKFLGALPSDFYKLTHVDYDKIFDHKKIAIVFNLDEHNKSGSHWVSFLIDNVSRTLEYYDSLGLKPNDNIQEFINIVSKYLKRKGYNYKYLKNTIRNQYENTECGVYAIYFIIQRLLGFDFNWIIDKPISDNKMNKFRSIIFRPR